MRVELLDIPERRMTILAELLRFFEETGGKLWKEQLEKFLRTFTGIAFSVPGPDALREIHRDEQIVKALKRNRSVEGRIQIMREHGLSHAYLENIWRVCEDSNFEPPIMPGGRAMLIEEAGRWMRKYPRLVNDIVAMFTLTAPERARARARGNVQSPRAIARRERKSGELTEARAIARRKRKKDELTETQLAFLLTLRRMGGSASDEVLRAKMGRLSTGTIKCLKRGGYLSKLKSGRLKLLAKGRRIL